MPGRRPLGQMNLRFTFTSATFDSSDKTHGLVDELTIIAAREELSNLLREPPIADGHSATVHATIEIAPQSLGTTAEKSAIENAVLVVQILSDLSEKHATLWRVAHDHEPDLGTIQPGELNDSLIEEIRTSIRVACSLSDMIVDDEFVEPETLYLSDEPQLAGEDSESWTGLLDADDDFIRFPEFDA